MRGASPIRGIQLGTEGQLTIANVETGETRIVAGGTPFTGTPAWTPDSKSLLANRVEGNDIYIAEAPVDGGAVRRITGYLYSRVTTQMQRGNGWFYYWYPAAVSSWGELAFGEDRDGTGQLWLTDLC